MMYETDAVLMAEIKKHLTTAELWGQLAEEATELAQAALKMQRLFTENNKPRKPTIECVKNVTEEHADLALCFKLIGWDDKDARRRIERAKLERWAGLIRKAQKDAEL